MKPKLLGSFLLLPVTGAVSYVLTWWQDQPLCFKTVKILFVAKLALRTGKPPQKYVKQHN